MNTQPEALQPAGLPRLDWVSPLSADDHAEYRDAAFLHRLSLGALAPVLADFWPRRGPQWDGLARFDGGVVLAEAKAHLAEFDTPASQAGPTSAAKIARAFAAVQADLGLPDTHWHKTYYQYANRLAHLWWLRTQGVNAHLVMIAFLNDSDMPGSASRDDWQRAYENAESGLGLMPRHPLAPFVHHLFVDTTALS